MTDTDGYQVQSKVAVFKEGVRIADCEINIYRNDYVGMLNTEKAIVMGQINELFKLGDTLATTKL